LSASGAKPVTTAGKGGRIALEAATLIHFELGYQETIMGTYPKEGHGPQAMAIEIHDPEAERLARELADLTGEPVDAAVLNALRERLDLLRSDRNVVADLNRLAADVATYPVLDARTPEQIIGFDRDGLPS
jgi:antitoxin VapB